MLLVDANVLLHATNSSSRQHTPARAWLVGALGAREPVGFAWTVVLAFLRLATHRGVFPRPLTPAEAADLLEQWLGAPPSVLVDPTPRHLPLLRGLLADAGTAGNLVGDAHLAALALEYDAEVVSFDRDFARFPGVRHRLPGACS
jgi:toxin-antitoxin system PIN domain toxin